MTANLPTQAGKAWLMWPFAVDSQPLLKLSRPLLGTITRLLSALAAAGFVAALLSLLGWLVLASWCVPLTVFFIGGLVSALSALFWLLGGVANPDRSGADVGGVLPGLDASEPWRRMSDFLLYLDQRLTPARLQHSQGVMLVMADLVDIYGLQPDQRLLLLNPPSGYPAHLASHRLSSYAKYV